MLKCGYGHPLSGHIFISRVVRSCERRGWKKVEGTSALYTRGGCLLCLYVDDLKISGSQEEMDQFWSELGTDFRFKAEPAVVEEFLGMRYTRMDTEEHSRWHVDLADYIRSTVAYYEEHFGMVKPSRVPTSVYFRSKPESYEKFDRSLLLCQVMVGRLLWIARTVRPELAQVASSFGSRILSWDKVCESQLSMCMGYLKLTPDLPLEFKWPKNEKNIVNPRVELHTDSDWTSPRSQSGAFGCLTCGEDGLEAPGLLPTGWNSKKQPITQDSSTTAEVVAAHYGVRSMMPFLLGLRDAVGRVGDVVLPLVEVRIDNSIALKHFVEKPCKAFDLVSKAIGVRMHLMRDLLKAKVFGCSHVRTYVNRSDVLTKPLEAGKLRVALELSGIGGDLTPLAVGPAGQACRAMLWTGYTALGARLQF